MKKFSLRLRVLIVCSLCLCGHGCTGPADDPEILEQDALVEAYIALLKHAPAEAQDTSAHEVPGILQDLGVTEQQVRRSVESYGQDPVRWKAFYQEVVRRLETEAAPKPDSGRVTRRDPAQPQAVPFGR
jgi:hypothetical protein